MNEVEGGELGAEIFSCRKYLAAVREQGAGAKNRVQRPNSREQRQEQRA